MKQKKNKRLKRKKKLVQALSLSRCFFLLLLFLRNIVDLIIPLNMKIEDAKFILGYTDITSDVMNDLNQQCD